MASHEIDYQELIEAALRGVVREALQRVVDKGLPGAHHFLISFRTDHPELEMPGSLRRAHPQEMTIVLQHQFWDLVVDEEAFAVTLRFGGEPARLRVPWSALKSFVDPAAEFGLRFGSWPASRPEETEEVSDAAPQGKGEVVSLEDFRKRDG